MVPNLEAEEVHIAARLPGLSVDNCLVLLD